MEPLIQLIGQGLSRVSLLGPPSQDHLLPLWLDPRSSGGLCGSRTSPRSSSLDREAFVDPPSPLSPPPPLSWRPVRCALSLKWTLEVTQGHGQRALLPGLIFLECHPLPAVIPAPVTAFPIILLRCSAQCVSEASVWSDPSGRLQVWSLCERGKAA